MNHKIIEIDGSYLEGGGQILRTAMALSAITKKPCRIFNIRKLRPKPGLANQHLLGIQNIAKLSSGYLEGDELGSQEIKFFSKEIINKDLIIRINTAASITLLLQCLLPTALFGKNPLKIYFYGGGTDVPFSPPIDYFQYVFLKILEQLGAKTELKIIKRGYYPTGGAEIEIKIFPARLNPANLIKRGYFKKIIIISGSSASLKHKKVAERQIIGAREILKKFNLPLEEKLEYYDTLSPGSQICIIACIENALIGANNLGKIGKQAEEIGRETALELLMEEKRRACLDKYLADQILPYMALSGKKSQIQVSELSNHCKTNIWAIEKFIEGKFKIQGCCSGNIACKKGPHLIKWLPF